MAKHSKNMEGIMDQGKDLIKFYRDNPCVAAYELLGVDLAPIQRLVFNDMWFKNYVIAVCSRGMGKSLNVDSLSHMEGKGLVYLNEELPPVPSYLEDGQEEVIDLDDKIYSSKGFRPTKKLSLEKGIRGKKLKTNNGFVQKGSNHHKLLVLGADFEFKYKKIENFVPGEKVCIQRGQEVFGSNEIPIDDARLIGLFIGDGSIGEKYTPSITTADEQIINFCKKYCDSNNVGYRITKDKRTKNTYNITFKRFDHFFEKYKIDRCLSYYKSVPYSIRTSSREAQIAFLQGYFDADGTIYYVTGETSCCSVSKKLLKEIQMMLLNFGIVSKLKCKKTKSKFGKAYYLYMHSYDSYRFKELIGFKLERQQKILETYFNGRELNTNKDTIPFIKDLCYAIRLDFLTRNGAVYNDPIGKLFSFEYFNKKEITYSTLHKFLRDINKAIKLGFEVDTDKVNVLNDILYYNYYFDTVEYIEDWHGDCYDFQMDMEDDVEPNYFANGFINHNTFLLGLLAALSAMLYPGYRVGLIGPVFRQSLSMILGTYDTFWTDGGLNTGAEKFFNKTVPNKTIIQSNNSQNTVLSKWKNDERACMSIKTTKGFELSGSIDHSIMVLDKEDNTVIYKELQDITEDDHIVIRKGFNYFGDDDSMPNFDEFEHNWRTKDCAIPKELTPDLAYWMGLLIGDGCVSVSENKRKQRIDFVSEDQDLLDSFENYLRKYFLIDKNEKYIDRRNRKNNTWEIQYFCKKLAQYLLKCDFTKTTALDKKIPDIIKKASKEVMIAFLQGLMDTDGGVYVQKGSNCTIAFNTSSKQLSKEVHSVLLNLGIVSNLAISKKACIRQLPQGNKPSKCAEAYKIRITGQMFIKLFNDIVGFRCIRKKEQLDNYIDSHFKNEFGLAKSLGLPSSIVENNDINSHTLFDQGFYFVKLVEKDYFFAETMDIEVENEHCYWASGFINHNSKLIFHEVEKLYDQSSILREATAKKPTRGSDTCYLKFKSVAGKTPSYIEALPLSDGSKIRGSRFYTVVVDELAQVPDQVLDMVLRPMGATALAPMERVRRLEEQQRLIDAGLAEEGDFEEESVNKMIMASSGYYKFNHMWRRMKDHWKMMAHAEKQGVESSYSVWQVPYWDLPVGFLDMNNINEAKRIMSNHEYSMEYEAVMVSDSEGFFKASLLEDCTIGSEFTINLVGESNKSYIIGVDPNQGGSASCGVIIIETGKPNKIVNAIELKSRTTQELTVNIQNLCDQYNVLRVFVDRGGGGKAIMDLLEEGYGNSEPMIDRTNPDNIHKEGRHILEMVNFNPAWISDANFTTKSMLEDKSLMFPELFSTADDVIAKKYKAVDILKSQLLSIVVTQTATGILHFDTPSKNMNKDLYSALILAAHGARMLERELEEEGEPILYGSGGLVRTRNQGTSFNHLTNLTNYNSKPTSTNRYGLGLAVLQKKLK